MPTEAEVREALVTGIGSAAHVAVTDVTGGGACGAKFDVIVVCADWEGVGLLERHRAVNGAIAAAGLSSKIHALTIKAWTPAQWASNTAAGGGAGTA